jgi:hypothetical protein
MNNKCFQRSIMSRWSQVPDSPSASSERRVNRNKKSHSSNVYSRFFFLSFFQKLFFKVSLRFFSYFVEGLEAYRYGTSRERIQRFNTRYVLIISVWQCCGSEMFIPDPGSRIPDPDFYPSRIPDPGSRIPDPGSKNSNKRERWKKISCHTFFVATNFTKL